MNTPYEDAFEKEMREAFGSQGISMALFHFQRAMRARAEQESRGLCLGDDAKLQAQAGKITILHELADWAISALEAVKSQANDSGGGAIPGGPV